MQETRRQILEILRDRTEATVDDIVLDLEALRGSITSVTVRHHLAKLQEDGLVADAQMRHRSSPGRPRHIYVLTERGTAYFPNNYPDLASNLLQQMQATLPAKQVNVIIEGVADSMAAEASLSDCKNLQERLVKAVEYLNAHGYEAQWQSHQEGYILQTTNCPYHKIAHDDQALCHLDMRLISQMLGVIPRLMSRVSDGDDVCSYLIPE